MAKIPFNKPFVAGKELYYIAQAVTLGNLGGDGHFTRRACRILEDRLSIGRVLLTPSCTAALEMAAMLCNFEPGDEVILPSFTFVSTASAFVRAGATPVFVDIRPDTLNLDERLIEQAVTSRTKAVCPVHYAGVACEMDPIMELAEQHGLLVVEDAAQAVNSFYRERALGSIGHLGCFSFHETKNYISGEGGALCVNSPDLVHRAEIIRDKGTNRGQFFRGEVAKYTWVDLGSSYVPSEITAAFLSGQLEMLEEISARRGEIHAFYRRQLQPLEDRGLLRLPITPPNRTGNYHMFYVLVEDEATRNRLLEELRGQEIHAVFHYVPLHNSPMGRKLGSRTTSLPITEEYAGRLIRLPFFHEISEEEQLRVAEAIETFFAKR